MTLWCQLKDKHDFWDYLCMWTKTWHLIEEDIQVYISCNIFSSWYFFTGKLAKEDKKQHETEAVAWECSVKKVSITISQNSQENTFGRVSF